MTDKSLQLKNNLEIDAWIKFYAGALAGRQFEDSKGWADCGIIELRNRLVELTKPRPPIPQPPPGVLGND